MFHNIYFLTTYSKVKLRCFVIVLIFGRKRIISVLLAFNKILFALNHWTISERERERERERKRERQREIERDRETERAGGERS